MTIRLGALMVVAGLLGAPVAAADGNPAEPVAVMVLGTYHFANPGQDINNVVAEDVRTPRRQAELERLSEALAQWKPTRIMIERVSDAPDLVDRGYSQFTPASLASERSETVQIGYRLARRLGMPIVYGIDEQPGPGEPDYFPFEPVRAFAETHAMRARLQSMMDAVSAETKRLEALQPTYSIAAQLIPFNDPEGPITGIAHYYELLAIGNATQQPAAELNAMWYMRNAKIFGKLQTVARPGDRVLVIFGAGHGYWLRHFASESPGFTNVDPRPWLERATADAP